ncbi:hypothetical protein AGABI1DRAFT_114943 [Agaricus bisporus var. burnettii JB137-S8]|uniref:Protein kinase domain-containing protein n=1 Tax=Agaricus bisporus var. burnettii (strain JB137-S8 / ATCC MYA-4627 / FGSC 10392) TaxID=597362 RepID=K5VUK2_AGABU|nr:uncharacterized protein AGABI1DRAFT_114943 [Agaricus bisporus var. burnettii JB137-S8]EKM78124.1 hypothetical protein AGABI1DRAFT_114943 [Agaricus bisporus var. burnettii JB137-S8]
MGCCFSEPVDFDGEVTLFHFDLLRAIGRGAFGKVRVVEHKRSKKLYALKYIDKSQCIRDKAVAHIIQERRLLEEIDHPFVVNLRYAFQDDLNCFFVMDLMLGGDLRFHMNSQRHIPEEAIVFWIAELSCALDYLHRQRIIHRDLKPDNILLDEKGHVHITDFNVAIHCSQTRLHTSVAGSLAYMAPEVVGRKGYNWTVDWWSLGITAYELLFRKRPFDGRTGEKMTYSILNDPLKFPDDRQCSKAALSVVRGFIDRDVSTRLGCRPDGDGFDDIRDHAWFSSINWDALEAKKSKPPFVPDMTRANFDVSHELDEFLVVEKPLTHKKRKPNPDLEKMKPGFGQLEKYFTVYDFSKSQRMSYYPHNQAIGTESTNTDQTCVQASSDTIIPTATIAERSQGGSTMLESGHYLASIPPSRGPAAV